VQVGPKETHNSRRAQNDPLIGAGLRLTQSKGHAGEASTNTGVPTVSDILDAKAHELTDPEQAVESQKGTDSQRPALTRSQAKGDETAEFPGQRRIRDRRCQPRPAPQRKRREWEVTFELRKQTQKSVQQIRSSGLAATREVEVGDVTMQDLVEVGGRRGVFAKSEAGGEEEGYRVLVLLESGWCVSCVEKDGVKRGATVRQLGYTRKATSESADADH